MIAQKGEPVLQTKLLSLVRLSTVVGVIGLSILCLIISLFLPVFNTANGGLFDGFSVMLIGWMAIFYFLNWGLGSIGWYANLLLPVIWVCLTRSKSRKAFNIGLLALVISIGIALCSLLLIHQSVIMNEGGGTSEIVSVGIGFYVWLASFVICIFGYIATIIVDLINTKKYNPT